jgi:dihydropteroate synthase
MPSNIESPQDTFFLKNKHGILLNLDEPVVMGILNVTPDSFFDGGKYSSEETILNQVKKMTKDGASIIDIGGYSSRPGAKEISLEEEISRTIPIIKNIRKNNLEVLISIDTFRSEVAQRAIDAGANIINDISGGELDDEMFKTVAKLDVPYILMHMKGTPQSMQDNPSYGNIVEELKNYFNVKINELNQLGVNNIILDLGFGFGKSVEHNYELLNKLNEFQEFNSPILTGISRKSMINKVLNTKPEEALNGTTVLNTIALQKGSKILRVHDIKEAVETIKLVTKLNE